MINILVMKKDDNNIIDIIQTSVNETLEDVKKYYNTNKVVLSKDNTIYKVLQYLILNGYTIKDSTYKTTTYYSIIKNNKLISKASINVLYNLGQELNIYTGRKVGKYNDFFSNDIIQENNILVDLKVRNIIK